MRAFHFKEQHPNGEHRGPCGNRPQARLRSSSELAERENPKEKGLWKNFKVMSSVFNSTFTRCQRSEVDLEDLHHFVTALVVIASLKIIC